MKIESPNFRVLALEFDKWIFQRYPLSPPDQRIQELEKRCKLLEDYIATIRHLIPDSFFVEDKQILSSGSLDGLSSKVKNQYFCIDCKKQISARRLRCRPCWEKKQKKGNENA